MRLILKRTHVGIEMDHLEMTQLKGSNKLEKAEILQATVEFLQRMYREGHVFASEARAIELRRLGFRECLLEVTRLLSTNQTSNSSTVQFNELRRSLLTSLHHYESQRESESKAYLTNVAAVANAIAEQQHPVSTVPSQEKTGRGSTTSESNKRGFANKTAVSCGSTRYTCNPEIISQQARANPPQMMRNSTRPSAGDQVYVPNDVSFAQNSFSTTTGNLVSSGMAIANSSLRINPLVVPYRPNESQSTSSPPLRSTPDDTDPGSSPQPTNSCLTAPSSTEKFLDFIEKQSPPIKREPSCVPLTNTPSNENGKALPTASYLAHQQYPMETSRSHEPDLRKVTVFSDAHHHTQTNPQYAVSTYAASFHNHHHHHPQPYFNHYVPDDRNLGRSAFSNSPSATWECPAPNVHCETSYTMPQTENYLTNVPYWQY